MTGIRKGIVGAVVTMTALIVLISVVLAVRGLGSERHEIYGVITASQFTEGGGGGNGSGGYSDIRVGGLVTVRDGSGKVIGMSSLGEPPGHSTITQCSFTVEVPRADFYAIEVTRRGEIGYSYEELAGRAWIVTVTLGR